MDARFWGDATAMPRPDEYRLKVVRTDGYSWETYATFRTMVGAMDAANHINKSGFCLIGIEPHCKDAGPFQTHALQVVWEG